MRASILLSPSPLGPLRERGTRGGEGSHPTLSTFPTTRESIPPERPPPTPQLTPAFSVPSPPVGATGWSPLPMCEIISLTQKHIRSILPTSLDPTPKLKEEPNSTGKPPRPHQRTQRPSPSQRPTLSGPRLKRKTPSPLLWLGYHFPHTHQAIGRSITTQSGTCPLRGPCRMASYA